MQSVILQPSSKHPKTLPKSDRLTNWSRAFSQWQKSQRYQSAIVGIRRIVKSMSQAHVFPANSINVVSRTVNPDPLRRDHSARVSKKKGKCFVPDDDPFHMSSEVVIQDRVSSMREASRSQRPEYAISVEM